ncbi:hypothetical protein BGW80DRAFT_1455205 [Lactifluus volemus]|nr:hypothetical protein BGW80DRAFT_1455205 [Lactifluus volemus]
MAEPGHGPGEIGGHLKRALHSFSLPLHNYHRILIAIAMQDNGFLESRTSNRGRNLDAEGLGATSNTSQPVGPLDDFHVIFLHYHRDRKPQFASWAPIQNTSDPHSRAVVTALYNDMYTIPVATLGHSLHKLGLPPPVSSFTSHGGSLPVHFADMLVRLNFDKLFDLHFPFAAVPDIYVNLGFKLHFKPDQEQEQEQETGALFVAMTTVQLQERWQQRRRSRLYMPPNITLPDLSFLESVEKGHAALDTNKRVPAGLGAKYAALVRGDAGGGVYLRLPIPGANYQENIWDRAPGSLLVQEAGGIISDLKGRPLDFGLGRTLGKNFVVVAARKEVHA